LKTYLINFLKFSLFLGVGLVILYLVYQKQDAAYQEDCLLKNIPAADCSLIQKVVDDFKVVNYAWIGLVLLLFSLSNISRAIRWGMLQQSLGYQPRLINNFFSVMLGYFANLGLPRLGEIIRAGTISKYENIPIEKVVGTVVVDRTLDVICLLLVIGLAVLLEFDTVVRYLQELSQLKDKGMAMLGLVGVLGVLLGFVYLFRARIEQTKIYKKVVDLLKGLWEGIKTVANIKNPGWFLFHTVNIWFMYFAMTYVCFFAFEPTAHLSPKVGLMAFVVGAIAITIPSPGGMGTYHLLVTSLLTLYGIAEADAFSFSNILFFSVQLGINVVLGIIALIVLPIFNRNYKPKPVQINSL